MEKEMKIRYSRVDKESKIVWDVLAFRDITTDEAETAIALYRNSVQGQLAPPFHRVGILTTLGAAD